MPGQAILVEASGPKVMVSPSIVAVPLNRLHPSLPVTLPSANSTYAFCGAMPAETAALGSSAASLAGTLGRVGDVPPRAFERQVRLHLLARAEGHRDLGRVQLQRGAVVGVGRLRGEERGHELVLLVTAVARAAHLGHREGVDDELAVGEARLAAHRVAARVRADLTILEQQRDLGALDELLRLAALGDLGGQEVPGRHPGADADARTATVRRRIARLLRSVVPARRQPDHQHRAPPAPSAPALPSSVRACPLPRQRIS